MEVARRHLAVTVFVALLVLVFATRARHLGGPIDDPHSWRQCDTAQYAKSFHEDGISLGAPSVCWLGGHKTLILEFPLPELVMALGYKIFGPHLSVARVVTLIFFIGSAFYLFLIVRRLAWPRLAVIATGVYCVLPLALFYSRAIHVDFAAVCFAHAMVFHLLQSYERQRTLDLLLATCAACTAFLIKAPYAFYFALPLFCVALMQPRKLTALVKLASCFAAALVAFLLWRNHAEAVNAAAPDWSFIPGYVKLVNMDWWYYGPLSMRWDLKVWTTIGTRLLLGVLTKTGTWLLFAGVAVTMIAAARGGVRRVLPLWAWTAGLFVYVLVFLNLNHIHDYYQIPFVALAAVWIALGIEAPFQFAGDARRTSAAILSGVLFAGVAFASFRHAETKFYQPDIIRQTAAEIIAVSTPAKELCIVAVDSRGTGYTDPRVLFRAGRMGWCLNTRGLTPEIIHRLKAEGATHIAIVSTKSDIIAAGLNLAPVTHALPEEAWKVSIAPL